MNTYAFGSRVNELMKSMPYSRIRRLIEMPSDQLVRVYSYQDDGALKRAENVGYLTGDRPHMAIENPEWLDAYSWIHKQMADRIPDFSGDWPMWAWFKRPSTKPKPRKYRGTSDNTRIIALVPRSRILISNYDDWHCVLNNNINCNTEEEWDAFHEDFPHHTSYGDDDYKTRYQDAIEPSWQKILSFEEHRDAKTQYWRGSCKRYILQACIDRIHLSEIVSVRHFNNALR